MTPSRPPARSPRRPRPSSSSADVHTYYGHIHALQGISIEVRRGEIVTLIGANGAGKTTTLKTISGLLHPRDGHGDLRRQRTSPRRRPTSSSGGHRPRAGGPADLLPPDRPREPPDGRLHPEAGRGEEDMRARLRAVPASEGAHTQRGGSLSGGEQQMLAIGRALMARPRVLLLDEPSLGLSPILVQQIFAIIRRSTPGARRSSSWSRTPSRRSTSRTAATSSRRAGGPVRAGGRAAQNEMVRRRTSARSDQAAQGGDRDAPHLEGRPMDQRPRTTPVAAPAGGPRRASILAASVVVALALAVLKPWSLVQTGPGASGSAIPLRATPTGSTGSASASPSAPPGDPERDGLPGRRDGTGADRRTLGRSQGPQLDRRAGPRGHRSARSAAGAPHDLLERRGGRRGLCRKKNAWHRP